MSVFGRAQEKAGDESGNGFYRSRFFRRHCAFTLVEVMMATFILAIVMGGVISTASFGRKNAERQREIEVKYDAISISQAIALYVWFEKKAPSDFEDLTSKGYVVNGNVSPWGTPYAIDKDGDSIRVTTTDSEGQRKVVIGEGSGK